MLMERIEVLVPAQPEREADLNEFGMLSTQTRSRFGAAAVEAGTPDYGQNGEDPEGVETDSADVIANILHHVSRFDGDATKVIERAVMHFEAEERGETL